MKRFQNILVAIDSRFEKQPALETAARLAEHNSARLKVVDVIPEFSWLTKLTVPNAAKMQQLLADEKAEELESLVKPYRDREIEIETSVLTGKTSSAIVEEVLRSEHDLVMRVTKGAGSQNSGFFGTTGMHLLRKSPCAVWLVKPEISPKFGKILAAVDPAPNNPTQEQLNRTILQLGISVADYEDGELHVVHAWDLFNSRIVQSKYMRSEFEEIERNAESEVARILDSLLEPFQLSHESDNVHLLRDEVGAGRAIPALVKQESIELVVMGTIARSGVAGALIGNTAEHILDQVECSVLAIKPDGFISPVSAAKQNTSGS